MSTSVCALAEQQDNLSGHSLLLLQSIHKLVVLFRLPKTFIGMICRLIHSDQMV